MKTLVLGLGNELLGDDGAGILAARALKDRLEGRADVIESSLSGLALIDFFIGYDQAMIIDAMKTGNYRPGSVRILDPDDLDTVSVPSPHYAGLPEMVTIARYLDLDFPRKIRIFALEADDPYTIGGTVSPAIKRAIKHVVQEIEKQINKWN